MRIIKLSKEISMSLKTKSSPESIVRYIKPKTRRKFTTEEKIQIISECLIGEQSIAGLCRREGIYQTMYYKWNKAFLDSRKEKAYGDTVREAGSEERESTSYGLGMPTRYAPWRNYWVFKPISRNSFISLEYFLNPMR